MIGSPNLAQTINQYISSHRQIFKQFDHHKLKNCQFLDDLTWNDSNERLQNLGSTPDAVVRCCVLRKTFNAISYIEAKQSTSCGGPA